MFTHSFGVRMTSRSFLILGAVLCPVGATAQTEVPRSSSAVPWPDGVFSAVFQPLGRLDIEETTDFALIRPFVVVTPEEIVIAEPREGKVAIYDHAGHLRHVFGRRGGGPGEYMLPVSARPVEPGEFVVADAQLGRITRVVVGSEEAPRIMRAPVGRVTDILMVDGGYVVAGRQPGDDGGHLLHLWSGEEQSSATSFFPMPLDAADRFWAEALAWTYVAVLGDSIAATFSLSDSIFFFDAETGAQRGSIAIPFTEFNNVLTEDLGKDPRTRRAAIDALTRVFSFHRFSNGDFIVQTARTTEREITWSLLIMTSEGQLLHEITDTPRLLGAAEERLYFQIGGDVAPNQWGVVARRRTGS